MEKFFIVSCPRRSGLFTGQTVSNEMLPRIMSLIACRRSRYATLRLVPASEREPLDDKQIRFILSSGKQYFHFSSVMFRDEAEQTASS